MSTLLVGFDSAWTAHNKGALVGAVERQDGTCTAIAGPAIAGFEEAEAKILEWQRCHSPGRTIILIDQPTIVANSTGQRPVENIVSSSVSLRFGGMQPANTQRKGMFDAAAPIWPFLNRFGGPAQLDSLGSGNLVVETYPVLEIISRGWVRADPRRATGRLPKYNPERRRTFSLKDWSYLCERVAESFALDGLNDLEGWCRSSACLGQPRKADQDCLDACICLLIAIALAKGRKCLATGTQESGYIVASDSSALRDELRSRCTRTERNFETWTRRIGLKD